MNGSRFIQACAALAQAMEEYAKSGIDVSYGLVYNMFPGYSREVVEQVLNGSNEVYWFPQHNYFLVFFNDKEVSL